MSLKYKDLVNKSDDEIIKLYDETALHTSVGLNYFTAELERRSNDKKDKVMIKCTKQITIMTFVMTIATLVNVYIAIIK
ncbi:hypothetical protein SAMN02745751_01247 [Dethiosulfatibacter aminovorans DSM 17477]|uniref:Uncharacterized protein n=1 Tax=Dethiosulfatibacter aminovorans DSM 17477 TaxID=1121476 RepID=A0A1M6EM22_9FIRM|nr:hypothetical protein SAMN02745751_01247 [Dethiosulfatibacter aminovorans DSM 17477]